MKIAMVMSVFGEHAIGGAERTAEQIALGLAHEGHAVSIVSLCAPGTEPAFTQRAPGLVHLPVPLAQLYDPYGLDGQPRASRHSAAARAAWHALDVFNPVMGSRLDALWQRQRPDIVVTHTLQGFSVAGWRAARHAGAALVHVVHDHSLVCPNTAMTRGPHSCDTPCTSCGLYSRARRWAGVDPDVVVGPSRTVLERHHRFGWFHGVADQRVIENAIAPDWPRAPGPRPAVAERPLRLGYLGRLDATKGLDTLLEAVRHLPAGAFELHIAGPGDPAWVREDLERHGLGPAVRLHGVVKPAPFLDGIDVLVTPSRAHETFCNVVMEAGCLGIPAIVSDRGALPERVEQGASGWIFPAGDAQALARVLHQCLDHPADVAARGAVALQSRPRYEPAHQAQAWSTLCRDLATRSGAAA